MLNRPARILLTLGFALVVFLILGRALSRLVTEVLWFDELGFGSVFWKQVWARIGVRLVTGSVAAAVVILNLWIVVRQLGPVHLRRRYGNLEIAEQVPRSLLHAGIALAGVLAGWWLSGIVFGGDVPLTVLAWLNHGPWGVQDPLFGRDLSFFAFNLPVYSRVLDYLLLVAVWSVLLVLIGYVLVGAVRLRDNRLEVDENPRLHFAFLIAGMVLLFAVRYWVGRYSILLEGSGFAGAVGYTDVHARLPAHRVLAVLSFGAAAALVYGALRRAWWPPLIAVGMLLLASVALGFIYPSIIQKLRVEPTELQRERRYIEWNLEFTRRAYGLHEIDRFAYRPTGQRVGDWASLRPLVERLSLWDAEPLQTVFNQLQSLHAYYSFPSVHSDRYGPPGAERQVAIAVREFSPEGLPAENRTWGTLRLNTRQVRGLGAVVSPAAERTVAGDPVFWLTAAPAASPGDSIAPVRLDPSAPAALELSEPTVLFGETMEGYLVLGSRRDTLAGAQLRGSQFGIPLSTFARVAAFSWRFGDRNLLFAEEVTESSRIIFRRRVGERVARIAPFIAWDTDVHPVIVRGRIVWMIDGYAMSQTFPIAAPRQITGLGSVRYLRNTVKATVDGLTGAVSFYALRDDEPILESYRRIFPELFKPISELPPELLSHMRYPASYLQLQADILKDYHVTSADMFFAGENRWELPQEQGPVGAGRAYRPNYLMARLPTGRSPEFVVMTPFIARNRQNMSGLLVVQNDVDSYGRMLLLELPRDRQITGPRQVQSLLEQDPEISRELTLLQQKGSDVEFGRLRIVPLDSAILYILPVYLAAAGNSIPQLQQVIASDGRVVHMQATVASAIDGLYPGSAETSSQVVPTDAVVSPSEGWPEEALQLLEAADRALRNGDWTGFGERWRELRELLARLAREQGDA